MARQHKIILETENVGIANLILDLFASGELTKTIMESPEYTRKLEAGEIAEMVEETEVYHDDVHKDYKQHKVQISTL